MTVVNLDMRKEWTASKEDLEGVVLAAADIEWKTMHHSFRDECQSRLDEYKNLDDVSRAALILDYKVSITDMLVKSIKGHKNA